MFTTVELKINFLKPVWEGRLTAVGEVIKAGRTLALIDCRITDEEGSLVAYATSTCMTLREKLRSRRGPSRHAGGGRLPGRGARVHRREPSRRFAGAWGAAVRGRRPRVEPEARRGRVCGPHLAEGVRRRRRAVQPPGDLPRGAGARRGSVASRRDRPRHGRPDDHRLGDRRAEGALSREDPERRGDLVPGLLRARCRQRPRRGAHPDRGPRRPLPRQRAEGVVVVRAHRRLLHPRRARASRRSPATRTSRT